MRRHGKKDGNHDDVVEALIKAGFSVQSLANIGDGCPDVLCGKGGYNILLEIKMPGEATKPRGGLRKEQAAWHDKWGGQVVTVYGPEHALELLGRRPRI